MKKILKLFLGCLLISQATWAQSIALNITDQETGNRFILTSNKKGKDPSVDDSVARSGIVLFAAGYQEDKKTKLNSYFIDLNIVHNDNRIGCLKEDAVNAILTLADGSQISCFQISETDCGKEAFKGVFALMAKSGNSADMQANFERLQKSEIKRIELITTEKKLVYKMTDDSQEYIKKHFSLLASTIKTASK
ncbi:MAG: hypothetical protein V4581_08955 [Bacteroidota bacterium]